MTIDLGGTRIRSALVDAAGRLLVRRECPTEAGQGPEAVIERIVGLAQEVREASPADGACIGVGVGAPGPLDAEAGLVLSAPNLPGWENLPLRQILETRLGLPVRLANDANVAALGEWRWGAGQGYSDLLYLTISTGIGGGIVADGRLLLGRRGLAGEVGHIILEPAGPRCTCGNRGCWEALASGTAIGREGARAVREGRAPLLAELCAGEADRVGASMVGEAARRGDPTAGRIIRRAAIYSGSAIASLIHLFSPGIVLLGGGVMALGDLFLRPIRQTVRRRVMPAYRDAPIARAALGGDAGLIGAAALFLDRRDPMSEETLSPETIEQVRRQVLQSYPELEGAEVSVRQQGRSPEEIAVATRLGMPLPHEAEEPRFSVTFRKMVVAEDGVRIPLTVRVTVDTQGRIVKGQERH